MPRTPATCVTVYPNGAQPLFAAVFTVTGCHRAINLSGDAPGAEVAFNDIRHHMRYTNGYALVIGATGGVDVHHNTITSLGRGAHLTRAGILFHDNYMDLAGHMTLDDLPQGTPFQEARIAVHGIKLETSMVVNTKVFNRCCARGCHR